MDKQEQCKKMVPGSGWGTFRQCSRKAVKDGYCKQHHPDSVKARDDASMAKFRAKCDQAYEKSRLANAAPDLLAYAKAVEAWEAKLLMKDDSWRNGLPVFTQELYDKWMELQAVRNAAIKKAKGES